MIDEIRTLSRNFMQAHNDSYIFITMKIIPTKLKYMLSQVRAELFENLYTHNIFIPSSFSTNRSEKETVEKDLMRNPLIDIIFHYTKKHFCYRFYSV